MQQIFHFSIYNGNIFFYVNIFMYMYDVCIYSVVNIYIYILLNLLNDNFFNLIMTILSST